MRIIGGIASGIEISVPHGSSVRPSSASAKKALFDSIGDFNGKTIADLFAGSGALGLEAASRGAANLIFIEKIRKNCNVIEQNCKKIADAGAAFNYQIICAEIPLFFTKIPSRLPFPDIIFSDPPYPESIPLMTKLLKSANFAKWAANSILVWETPDSKLDITTVINNTCWEIIKIRNFGGKDFAFVSCGKKE